MSNTDKPSETPRTPSGEPKSKAKGKRIADADDLSPALISSIHKVVESSGVQVGASAADADHPLWNLVDQLEEVNFIDS